MSTCTVYYPGLLGPNIPIDELTSSDWPGSEQIQNLGKILAYGKQRSIACIGIDARIMECLGIDLQPGAELPINQLRVRQIGVQHKQQWCLDPVHISVDRDEAILLANESLSLSEKDAQILIADLNQHLQQDNLQIHYHSEHQWLLSGDIEVSTSGLNKAMLQSIIDYQPKGKDEKKWRSLINELQMLLHSHSINITREQQGELSINSLWLWGGGAIDQPSPNIDLVYSNDLMVKDAAHALGVEIQALPDCVDGSQVANKNIVLFILDQIAAVRNNDAYAWMAQLEQLDHKWLAPLINYLEKGVIDRVILKSDTVEIELRKTDLPNKLISIFKKNISLEKHIMQLRAKYGR